MSSKESSLEFVVDLPCRLKSEINNVCLSTIILRIDDEKLSQKVTRQIYIRKHYVKKGEFL